MAGTWKDLTDNVNSMAGNLTAQVRSIAKVDDRGRQRRPVARSSRSRPRARSLALADTINEMIDTAATPSPSRSPAWPARSGIEGKLGGQAKVPGAAGTWRDLTDNVNQLAANLTTQVRAIAEVATAVTKGDLTRSITVEAQGEVAALKDNINEMIRNLRDTTQKNTEQDWLKTNLAKFTRMLQGQRDLRRSRRLILSRAGAARRRRSTASSTSTDADDGEPSLRLLEQLRLPERKHLANEFRLGEGLVGQCALEKERILLTDVPRRLHPDQLRPGRGRRRSTSSSCRSSSRARSRRSSSWPRFHRFSEIHLTFLDQLTESIGIVLNTIAANMRTEELLKQSQSLAEELQSQQEELKETNKRLEQQAALAARVRGAAEGAAGRAAADQRGAGGEGARCSPSRRRRSRARTARSSWRSGRWRRRPSSSR